MLGGAAAGIGLRRSLPEHHLNDHSKDLVRRGSALVATMSALGPDLPTARLALGLRCKI
jgi:hypothetical protein